MRGAEERGFTSGTQGQQLTAIGTARNHMQTFKDTADALDNGDLLLANKVGNAIGMQFGSDKATNFNIAKSAFAGEVGKAFAGANVGVQDRQELMDKISAASSPAQLKGYADTADKLLEGKQKSLKQSYDQGVQNKPNFGGGGVTKTASQQHISRWPYSAAAKDHGVSVDEATPGQGVGLHDPVSAADNLPGSSTSNSRPIKDDARSPTPNMRPSPNSNASPPDSTKTSKAHPQISMARFFPTPTHIQPHCDTDPAIDPTRLPEGVTFQRGNWSGTPQMDISNPAAADVMPAMGREVGTKMSAQPIDFSKYEQRAARRAADRFLEATSRASNRKRTVAQDRRAQDRAATEGWAQNHPILGPLARFLVERRSECGNAITEHCAHALPRRDRSDDTRGSRTRLPTIRSRAVSQFTVSSRSSSIPSKSDGTYGRVPRESQSLHKVAASVLPKPWAGMSGKWRTGAARGGY